MCWGVREIFEEWTAWRCECVRRRVYFQLQKKKDKLHLLKGLGKILLDIDKAIAIIRETELDAEVIPNLMIGFGIDQVQAEYTWQKSGCATSTRNFCLTVCRRPRVWNGKLRSWKSCSARRKRSRQ